jgi:hypothetical protein
MIQISIMYQNVPTMHNIHVQKVCSSCTTPMYIIHVHQHHAMCQKISSMEYINHMPTNMPTCASTNMPTMCIPICQPCASTNMPTMCIYQHVHLPNAKCIISLMICLHHEPSAIAMYQTNINCCANQVIPST